MGRVTVYLSVGRSSTRKKTHYWWNTTGSVKLQNKRNRKIKSHGLSWIKMQFKVYLHGIIVPSNLLKTPQVHPFQTQIWKSKPLSSSLPVFDVPIKRVWLNVYTAKPVLETGAQGKVCSKFEGKIGPCECTFRQQIGTHIILIVMLYRDWHIFVLR